MKVNQLVDRFRHIEMNHEKNISKKTFNENYGYPKRPVLLKDAFQDWHIKKDWNSKALKMKTEMEFIAESSTTKSKIKTSINEYFQQKDRDFYIRETLHPESEFTKGYFVNHHQLNLFNCWYESFPTEMKKNCMKWLYVGNEGTYTDIHRDVWGMGSWLYLIEGTKVWFIYPRNFNNIIEKNKVSYGIKNLDKLLSSDLIEPMIAVQRPGEMMYVPGSTYHWVYNIESSIAYTGNFLNQLNYEEVRNYFSKKSTWKNKKIIEQMIIEGFKTVEQRTYAIKN